MLTTVVQVLKLGINAYVELGVLHFSDVPPHKTTEIFDGDSWVFGPELPEPRYNHALVSYQYSKVLLFSGIDYGSPSSLGYLNTTYEYDFATPENGWVQKEDMPITSRMITCAHIR